MDDAWEDEAERERHGLAEWLTGTMVAMGVVAIVMAMLLLSVVL